MLLAMCRIAARRRGLRCHLHHTPDIVTALRTKRGLTEFMLRAIPHLPAQSTFVRNTADRKVLSPTSIQQLEEVLTGHLAASSPEV